MTFTAVMGLSTNCVKFVGITSLPVDEYGKVLLPPQLSNNPPEEELFLIIERASEGNLLDFLERKLASADETRSWNITVDTLSSIATGVAHLHGSGIIHGCVPLVISIHCVDAHFHNLSTLKGSPSEKHSSHKAPLEQPIAGRLRFQSAGSRLRGE